MADISPYVLLAVQRAAQSASQGNDPHEAFANTVDTYWQQTGQPGHTDASEA